MGSFVTAGGVSSGVAAATAVAGPFPAGLQAGDRIYVAVSSGSANPNVLTDPPALGGTTWVKIDEFAPTSTFKTALYYADITAANAATWSSSSHTWTFATSSRTSAEWFIYRATDQTRAPAYAKISGAVDSVAATNVPDVTPGTYDWLGVAVLGRQSPGTDTAKTWTISGFSSDVERVDVYATNTGTGQKLSLAGYDTNGPASAAATGGGGGGAQTVTVTDAPPVNTYNSIALNAPATARIGATLDTTTLDAWKPRLLKNGWMRIFPNSDKLPPDWGDSRFLYCQAVGAHPFLSTKIDGDATKIQAIYDYFAAMPSWIKDDPNMLVWYVEHHEPEKEYVAAKGTNAAGGAAYIADYKAVWNKLATLPTAIRSKIRMGPALTKQWTEVSTKGNFDYQLFDPGTAFREFKGYDAYVDSAALSTTTSVYPTPATFLQYIKADNAGGQPKILVEFGAINKIGDDTGTGRAAFLQASYDEMKTWPDFGGFIWWNDHGTPSTASIANIGTARFFELDLRYASENTSADLAKVTTTITYGGSGGGSSARAVTPSLAQSNSHVWAFTVPMPTPAGPVLANVWSALGLPLK